MRARSSALLAALAIVLAAPAMTLAQPAPVEHDIDLRRAREQVVTVTVRLADLPADAHGHHSTVLRMPVWRPGMYSILDQAGSIRTLVARNLPPAEFEDPAFKTCPITKVDKSSWRIDAGPDDAVYVTYELVAASLDTRTRHADDTHAFLDPAAILMYTDETRGALQKVRVVAPSPDWRLASGLDGDRPIHQPGGFPTFVTAAPDYDRLADSPIEAGLHHTISFEVDGVPHDVVIWTGEPGLEDSAFKKSATGPKGHWNDLAKDLEKIIRAESALFGGTLPYKRYLFIVHAAPTPPAGPNGRGGTEHYNSCVMQTSPDFLTDDERYRGFLGLAAHEFFHTWNVKRFRPAELTPYDYQRENLTTLLWVAEGATTYYDSVLLSRAGINTRRQHLDRLASAITAHDNRLGSAVQPVADSSYDAWIKFNKKSADGANATVSFYDKGSLASFILDMLIRKANPEASLDDVMRALYAKFPEPTKGYTEEDLRSAIAAAAICPKDAPWLDAFFKDTIHGVARPDFEAALAVVGYELRRDAGKPRAYAGFTLTDEGAGGAGVTKVSAVATDSPALKADAGLVVGDIAVALDRRRLTAATLDRELAKHAPGEAVTLTLFRNDVLRDVTFTLADKPDVRYTIRKLDNPTEEQARQADRWLGPESR